jgi:glucose-6-phosphate isomerase
MAGRAVRTLLSNASGSLNPYPVFSEIPVDVAGRFSVFSFLGVLLKRILQNAKVSVMGSGQLSEVMSTVSKCVTSRISK